MLRVIEPGLVDYDKAFEFQLKLVNRLRDAPDLQGGYLLLLTHPHKSGTTPLRANADGLFVKIDSGEGARTWIGVQLLSRKLLDLLPSGPFSLFSEGYLPLVEAGKIRIGHQGPCQCHQVRQASGSSWVAAHSLVAGRAMWA